MSFLAGDVLIVKTTGERVCLICKAGNVIETCTVRRPFVTTAGSIDHIDTKFLEFELETLGDHAERQVNEMILKAQAQKRLIQVEQKLNKELEDAEVEDIGTPATKKSNPAVN